jgi:hypothetical protein
MPSHPATPYHTEKSAAVLLTKAELCDALHLPSTRMVDEMMRTRKIPFVKLGHRTVRFNLDRVLEALARLEVHAVGDVKKAHQ